MKKRRQKTANFTRTSISIPPAVHDWLTNEAAKYGLKVSPFLVQLIIQQMRNNGENKHDNGGAV